MTTHHAPVTTSQTRCFLPDTGQRTKRVRFRPFTVCVLMKKPWPSQQSSVNLAVGHVDKMKSVPETDETTVWKWQRVTEVGERTHRSRLRCSQGKQALTDKPQMVLRKIMPNNIRSDRPQMNLRKTKQSLETLIRPRPARLNQPGYVQAVSAW